jgi:hypothetical protein
MSDAKSLWQSFSFCQGLDPSFVGDRLRSLQTNFCGKWSAETEGGQFSDAVAERCTDHHNLNI